MKHYKINIYKRIFTCLKTDGKRIMSTFPIEVDIIHKNNYIT